MVKVWIEEYLYEEFCKITNIDEKNWSLFFCIAYSLLKVFARCKVLKGIFEKYSKDLKCFIQDCLFFRESDSNILNGFVSVISWIENCSSLKDVHKYLDGFGNEEYLNIVLTTGKIAFYYFFKDEDATVVYSRQPDRVFEKIAQRLKIYFCVWRVDGKLMYGPEESDEALIVNLLGNGQEFYWLVGKLDECMEIDENLEIDTYKMNFFYKPKKFSSLLVNAPINKNLQELDTKVNKKNVLNTHPELVNLLKSMAGLLIKHKIYSEKVQDQTKRSIQEINYLTEIQEINELLNLKSPFCELHKNSVYIQLFCKNEHCQICIFEKIKKEFRKDNFIIYCMCGVQIPPKIIYEIKQKPEYKEYSSKCRLS